MLAEPVDNQHTSLGGLGGGLPLDEGEVGLVELLVLRLGDLGRTLVGVAHSGGCWVDGPVVSRHRRPGRVCVYLYVCVAAACWRSDGEKRRVPYETTSQVGDDQRFLIVTPSGFFFFFLVRPAILATRWWDGAVVCGCGADLRLANAASAS